MMNRIICRHPPGRRISDRHDSCPSERRWQSRRPRRTKMGYVRLGTLVVLAISLVGCDQAPEAEKSFIETTSALVTGFTLHNLQTGYCLGTSGGQSSPSTGLIVWDCDGS